MKSGETKELGDGESEIPPTKLVMLLGFSCLGRSKATPKSLVLVGIDDTGQKAAA